MDFYSELNDGWIEQCLVTYKEVHAGFYINLITSILKILLIQTSHVFIFISKCIKTKIITNLTLKIHPALVDCDSTL